MADILLGLIVIAGITAGGIAVLFKMVDQRFPPVFINVHDRGILLQKQKYRLAGTTIVKDNLFRLLINDLVFCGDLNELEYDRLTSGARVYRAYLMNNWLFGVKHVEGVGNKDGSITYTRDMPTVFQMYNDDGKPVGKVTINKAGLLVPYKRIYAPQYLAEDVVTNNKAICSRFIEVRKQEKNYNDTTNPFVNTLVASLPMLLILVGLGVMLYLVVNSQMSNMVALAGQNAHITELLENLTRR